MGKSVFSFKVESKYLVRMQFHEVFHFLFFSLTIVIYVIFNVDIVHTTISSCVSCFKAKVILYSAPFPSKRLTTESQ